MTFWCNMSLRDRLNEDLREALRQRDEVRKETLRLALAAIRNAEIDVGHPLDDQEITGVLQRQVRQRRESIEEFRKGGRTDLVAREEAEMAILQVYMPPTLSHDEIVAAAKEVIARVGARGPADKGKVMPVIIRELAGRADGREINAVVTELLGGASPSR